ncbi:MAG: thioredoxin domain-containing protein [Anaerolineaceae bacterium]|nr:thioredoxin domain-containing protein [Anaerolineaceae bacterium]
MSDNKPQTNRTVATRRSIKQKRAQRERRQSIFFLVAGIVVVLVILGFAIYPQIKAATTPIGTIVQITPDARPQANGTAAGNPNAKVRIDVFEDFQCPVCRQFTLTIEPQLMKNEIASGQVYYVFHNFPFIDRGDWTSAQKESHQAANAAMCASAQGHFWDYHDILFANWTGENVGDFNDNRLVAYAQALNLNMGDFNTCFKANTFKSQIDADFAEGNTMGVTGTPTVFVNNKEVTPGSVPTYQQIQQAIQAAAAAK